MPPLVLLGHIDRPRRDTQAHCESKEKRGTGKERGHKPDEVAVGVGNGGRKSMFRGWDALRKDNPCVMRSRFLTNREVECDQTADAPRRLKQ